MSIATAKIKSAGSRKNAVAACSIEKGTGKIIINGKTIEQYFGGHSRHIDTCHKPFKVIDAPDKFDVVIVVNGGGLTGQAGAVCHAIARALVKVDENFKPTIKKAGLLTRDARMVERKKPGRPKARKRFQFSKR